MTVRAITFDCYGTLVDWKAGTRAWAEKLFARKGAEVAPEEFFRRWEEHQRALLTPYRGYRDLAARAVERVLRDLKLPVEPEDGQSFADGMANWRPFADTGEALRRLGGRYKVGIITNMDNVVLFETVARLGAPVHMRTSAEDARAYKPDPAIFKLALSRLGLDPGQVLHVAGNWEYDLNTARALGMKTGFVHRDRLERSAGSVSDLEMQNLSALADHMLAQT